MHRTGRIAAGFALVTAGVAMLALPGPGLVTIGAGLALLARDLRWADKLRQRLGAAATHESGDPPDQEGG